MQKKNMPSDFTYSYRPEKQVRTWTEFFIISLLCHLLIIVLILFFPTRSSVEANTPPAPTIAVDLVSFNPELPATPAAHKSPVRAKKTVSPRVKKKVKIIRPEYKPEPHKSVRIKTLVPKRIKSTDYVIKEKHPHKVLKSLKSKTFNSDRTIAAAIKKIEKKVAQERPQPIQKRIDKMKAEVEKQEKTQTKQQASTGPTGGGLPGPTGNTNPKDFTKMQIYQMRVRDILQRNWVFSDKLAGYTHGQEVRLMIKIMPDGQITDIWFEQRSGNTYLDESAQRTLQKSNPLPPLPQGHAYYNLMIGFTPSGLK